jgi:hypothetical protein
MGCRKWRELLSIMAIKRNIHFIYAFLMRGHTKILLDNRRNMSIVNIAADGNGPRQNRENNCCGNWHLACKYDILDDPK